MAKQGAVNQATKQGIVGVNKLKDGINDLTNKGYDPLTGQKSGQVLENIDRGQKKIGFLGSVGISIAIGVAVSFLVPGAGIIAVGIVQGIGTTAVEGAIGVMAGEDEPTPAPTEAPEPVVQGQVGDDTPTVQSENQPPPGEETIIYVDPGTTTTPEEEPPHEEPCCEEEPHEEPPEEPPMEH
jgi:hypothetical protein